MKAVRNSLMLFVASAVIAAAAPVQDESASFYREMLTNSAAPIIWGISTEPKFVLGPNTQLTGLFVDCIRPQETWSMLNPSVPARNQHEPVPPSLLPVMPLPPISNPAVHEADFAFLRLSFP